MKIILLCLFLILALFCIYSYGEGPHYKHKDNFVQLEFENAYADIKAAKLQIPKATSRTKAQLFALAPYDTGLVYYCSDCTNQTLCVSTGTSTGQFSGSSGRTAACN